LSDNRLIHAPGRLCRPNDWVEPLSIDQPVLDRVVREVRIRFHSHLFQYPRPVRAYRLHGQVELVGDLRDRRAAGELAEDLKM